MEVLRDLHNKLAPDVAKFKEVILDYVWLFFATYFFITMVQVYSWILKGIGFGIMSTLLCGWGPRSVLALATVILWATWPYQTAETTETVVELQLDTGE